MHKQQIDIGEDMIVISIRNSCGPCGLGLKLRQGLYIPYFINTSHRFILMLISRNSVPQSTLCDSGMVLDVERRTNKNAKLEYKMNV